MLLKCELSVCNRLSNASDYRTSYSTISLGKKTDSVGNNVVYFVVYTSKNKQGTKYMVKDNILQVHQKFMGDGKCTLIMKEPPHDLHLSKAVTQDLKKFLHVLKLAFKGQDTSPVAQLNSVIPPKLVDLEKPKTVMSIYSRKKYPMNESFPKTLEDLLINQCNLLRFDSRILTLQFLRKLDLSHNKLSTLPDNLDSLVNLSMVTLSNNLFETIPSALLSSKMRLSLTQLDMSHNKIKYLPLSFSELTALISLNLSHNDIEFLPGRFGQLTQLKTLWLQENKISLLPWSIMKLQLDFLDLSGNCFEKGEETQLKQIQLDSIPSLFELSARYVIKKRMALPETLPYFIREQLSNVKFCPCSSPCLSHCVPYIKSFDLSQISSTVSFGQVYLGRMMAKTIGYLCSKQCYEKWVNNPNTLFTSKRKT